jgi:hypothetical protein
MKSNYLLLTLLCASALTLFACSNANNDSTVATPTPTPDDPNTRPARLERTFQGGSVIGTDDEGKLRTEARQAVTEFVKKNLQGWDIKGMSSQVYPGYVFSIDADLEKSDSHMVVTFDVRRFFPESGDAYWLAIPANRYRLDRLHKLSDTDVLEQLRDAKEGIRSGPEQP